MKIKPMDLVKLREIDDKILKLLTDRGEDYSGEKPDGYYLAGTEVKIFRLVDAINCYRLKGTPIKADTLYDAIAYLKLLLLFTSTVSEVVPGQVLEVNDPDGRTLIFKPGDMPK